MIIAVDTGASKTLVARMTDSGHMSAKSQFPTPKDTAEYTTQLQKTILELSGKETPKAIIVALPGVIKDGVAVICKNLGWRNFDIRPALMKHFFGVPVWVENDANLAGLGETRMLDYKPAFSLYVTVSTGIGTGFITDGKIDPSLRLSEGGSMLVEYDGITRRWEDFASGRAIHDAYKKYARDITSKRDWRHISDRISRGFLALIPLVQPDVIIIGGSIGTYFDRYGDYLQDLLKEKLPAQSPCPPIRQAKHPEEAVIYGCYYHAINNLPHKSSKK